MITDIDLKSMISDKAYKVASKYIVNDTPMNETLKELFLAGDILNQEVLQRICEEANKHVYLHIFKNTDDRSNINFPLADKEKIMSEIGNNINDIRDFQAPPRKYNTSSEKIASVEKKVTREDMLKVASELEYTKKNIDNFLNHIHYEKTASDLRAQNYISKLSSMIHSDIGYGESVPDMAKVASHAAYRYTGNKDFSIKIAEFVSEYANEMDEKGHKVDFETEKIASDNITINSDSEFVQSIRDLSDEMCKIAGYQAIEDHYNSINIDNSFLEAVRK